MMTLEMILNYFGKGFAVYFGSYYGDDLMETAEEIREVWEDTEEDEWLYIESVNVDAEAHEIRVFIGNDE